MSVFLIEKKKKKAPNLDLCCQYPFTAPIFDKFLVKQ